MRPVPGTAVGLLTGALFLVHLSVLPNDTPLRKDAYAYFLKAQEILSGDFTPVVTRPIGWSLVEAPVLAASGSAPLRTRVTAVRVLSAAINALHLPVLFLLLRELGLGSLSTTVLLALFLGTSPAFVASGVSALAEPLFSVLLLLFFTALSSAGRRPRTLLLGGVLAGALSSIRIQGLVLPFFLLAAGFFPAYRSARRFLVGALLLSLLIASPPALHRFRTLGNPFHYGPNSSFFANRYEAIWVEPPPSLSEFLRTHPLPVLIQEFTRAAASNTRDAVQTLFPIPLSVFALVMVPWLRGPPGILLPLFLALWWISLLPIYRLAADARYWVPLIPFALILPAAGLQRLAVLSGNPRLALLLLAAVTVAFGVQRSSAIQAQHLAHRSRASDPGIAWVAANVRGAIATLQVGDLVMQELPDTRIGGRDEFTLCAPQTGLRILRPDLAPDLPGMLDDARRRGATHLLVAPGDEERRPVLARLAEAPPVRLRPVPLPPGSVLRLFAFSDAPTFTDPCPPYEP